MSDSLMNWLAVLAFLFVSPAKAQDIPKGTCWEIYQGTHEVAPYTALLLNKCDGNSYLLIKSTVADRNGKPSGSWIWRWSPINKEPAESILSPAQPPNLGIGR